MIDRIKKTLSFVIKTYIKLYLTRSIIWYVMLFGAIFFGVFNGNFIPLFIFIVTFGLFMFFGVIYSYTTTDGVGNIYQREVKDKDPKEPIFLGIYEFRGL